LIAQIAVLILHLLAPAPKHLVNRNAELRHGIASALVDAGAKYNQPPDLMAIWFFRESSLNPRKRGALGEIGVSQIHPCNWRKCKNAGYDVKHYRGQIMCGAMLADLGRRKCGSLEGGWLAYASKGGTCEGTPKARRIVRRRFKQWKGWRDAI
jgi:hypothetical protein